MTLSCKLDDAMLTMLCPQCARPSIRKGSWFKHVSRFRCAECGHATQLTYEDKLKLFDKHAKLTAGTATPTHAHRPAPERKAARRLS